jgi:phytoene desaturase
MSNNKVLIIGAGLGGLATALRLSVRGYKVEIVEKYHQAGGRLNQFSDKGFTFDVGPSFFSMSYEFDAFYKDCGIPNPLEYQQLSPLYTVNFANSDRKFNIYRDPELLAKEFSDLEPDFEQKLKRYLAGAKSIFHDTENKVVKRNFNGMLDYLMQLSKVPWKHAPSMFRSMWSELDRHFESHEVKVIFSLVAFFLGATPFDTPAVYKLLNYTELEHDGYWSVKGGMYKIAQTLVEELEKRGVVIHYNTEIKSVEQSNGEVSAVVDQNGNRYTADIFVSNSDAAAFRNTLLNRPKWSEARLDKMDWTLSPFTIYLGVKGKIEGLHHHNYFLGSNFKEYADKIFKMSVNPEKPYYYVNVSSKTDSNCAPEGCENLFILCPVPDLRYKPEWADADKLADIIIEDLGQRVGFDIKNNIITRRVMDPVEWRDTFNLYKGSGLGLAHGLNQIGAFRPANKDESLSNLFYVGASTVPGTGLPIVLISSGLVTERIEHEFALV